MGEPRTLAAEALLSLLEPLWQLVIGALVLVTVMVSLYRLFLRGPSRMGGVMLLAGGAAIGLAVVGTLIRLL
jgi:hypothetical protein